MPEQHVHIPGVVDAFVGGATDEELAENVAELLEFYAARARRRQWLADVEAAWQTAKQIGRDHLDGEPAPPSGSPSVALLTQQVSYLYDRVQQLTRWIVGIPGTPGIGDVVVTEAKVLASLIERDGPEPPA